MKSSTLFAIGASCTITSFAVPQLGVPLLTGAVVSFVVGEVAVRREEKYHKPVQQRRYAAWLQMLDDAFLYRLGVTQGLARSEIDWAAHHYKTGLNLKGTVEDKYFSLFTAGRPQPQAQPPQGQTIDVPSEPVGEAEQSPLQGQNETEQDSEDLTSLFAGASPLPEDGTIPVEAEVVLEAEFVAKEATFPTEDIAELIARTTLDRDNCGSILIACPKGTGKSNLLRAAIYRLHQLSHGTAQISIFNGKEDRDKHGQIVSTFCGLEADKQSYINAGDPDELELAYSRLAQITKAMEQNHETPMVQVLDEYNNILIAAEICTSLLKDERSMLPFKERKDAPPVPNYAEKIGLLTVLRITKGRSKLVADWITSHSPLVQDIGLNTKIQQSLTTVVLGRGDKLDAMHSALSGSNPVVKNPQARAELYEAFLHWEQVNNDMNRVVCLTNLAGKWRLCFLPKYPDVQPDINV